MHTRSLLDAWLRRNCSFIHRARLKALVKLVDSLLVGGKATVAELGRNMRTLAYEKHAIKCADRLIGNRHLAAERMAVYRRNDSSRSWQRLSRSSSITSCRRSHAHA